MEYLHTLTGIQAYALICFLVFVEEAGVPLPFLPGDVILLAAGYLAAIGVVSLWLFVPLLYLSAVLGALLCYTFSRSVGRRLVLRLGRLLRLSAARLESAERLMHRGGALAIAVARVLPGTRINASFAAGGLRLPLPRFLSGVLLGTPVWLLTFTLAGDVLGDRVTPLLPWFDRAVLVLIGCSAVVGLAVWRRRSLRRRDQQQQPATVALAA